MHQNIDFLCAHRFNRPEGSWWRRKRSVLPGLALLAIFASLEQAHAARVCSCPNGGQVQLQDVYVPFKLENGEVGDAMVHRGATTGGDAGAMVSLLLRAIGLRYTHSVMVTANGSNGYEQEVSHYTAGSDSLLSLIDLGGLKLKADKLAHLSPGLVTQDFDSLIHDYGFNLQTALVLKAANRAAAVNAAGAATQMPGKYRIQAYTDLAYMLHDNPGSHCSGLVYWSWQKTGGGQIAPVQ